MQLSKKIRPIPNIIKSKPQGDRSTQLFFRAWINIKESPSKIACVIPNSAANSKARVAAKASNSRGAKAWEKFWERERERGNIKILMVMNHHSSIGAIGLRENSIVEINFQQLNRWGILLNTGGVIMWLQLRLNHLKLLKTIFRILV